MCDQESYLRSWVWNQQRRQIWLKFISIVFTTAQRVYEVKECVNQLKACPSSCQSRLKDEVNQPSRMCWITREKSIASKEMWLAWERDGDRALVLESHGGGCWYKIDAQILYECKTVNFRSWEESWSWDDKDFKWLRGSFEGTGGYKR